jgi:hypothetical protein
MKMRFGLALAAVVGIAGLGSAQEPTATALPTIAPPDVPGNADPAPGGDAEVPALPPPAGEERLWVRGEYLLWWFKDTPLRIPLLLAPPGPVFSALTGIETRLAGALVGDGDVDTGVHQGARFTGGFWLDQRSTCGLEGSYFFLASQTTKQGFPSRGVATRILGVAPGDNDPGAGGVSLATPPPGLDGIGVLRLASRLQGAEANGSVKVASDPDLSFEVLSGFRFVDLRENLALAANPAGAAGDLVGGDNAPFRMALDRSDALNLFFGWQVGARAEYHLGIAFVSGSVKVALGDMYERESIAGSSDLRLLQTPAGDAGRRAVAAALQRRGLTLPPLPPAHLARHELAVVPEVGVNVGCSVTSGLRVFVGYDFLCLSDVIRPGNPIGDVINAPQVVSNRLAGNPPLTGIPPLIRLTGSEFWAQGIHGGIEFRY